MIRQYSKAEMLDYWKVRYGLAAPRRGQPDCEEPLSGLDLKLLDDIELWYIDLLGRADPAMLPVENVTAGVSANFLVARGATVLLPLDCIRVVSVKMSSWEFAVTTFALPDSDTDLMQRNPITRAIPCAPAAVLREGAIDVFGMAEGREAEVERLMATVRGDPEYYRLDPRLLLSSELLIH